jgi:hypothetical protein
MDAFLKYMSGWTGESDEHIDALINEHNLFVSLRDFNPDPAIDTEFSTLVRLATKVRDDTIAADSAQIAADVAAVASIWTFGMGMAAFALLETTAMGLRYKISSDSKELNNKLGTVDIDIAALVGTQVQNYIDAFKKNNAIIAAKAAKGMDGQTCRSILLQFMAHIELEGATLNAATFRQYANSARLFLESKEINDVYNALDKLNLGGKSDEDLKKYADFIKGFTWGGKPVLPLVQFLSLSIMAYRMKIARTKLAQYNEIAEFVGAEKLETSVFKMMDCWGKFFAGITVIASVADTILQILDIVDAVKQWNRMVDELNDPIKKSYKDFFGSIKEAATKYNEAIPKKKTG